MVTGWMGKSPWFVVAAMVTWRARFQAKEKAIAMQKEKEKSAEKKAEIGDEFTTGDGIRRKKHVIS